jgi:hypothetical protein
MYLYNAVGGLWLQFEVHVMLYCMIDDLYFIIITITIMMMMMIKTDKLILNTPGITKATQLIVFLTFLKCRDLRHEVCKCLSPNGTPT